MDYKNEIGGDMSISEQKKLDKIARSMLNTSKSKREPPTPTKEDLERSFRIVFNSKEEPVFEEVTEQD